MGAGACPGGKKGGKLLLPVLDGDFKIEHIQQVVREYEKEEK